MQDFSYERLRILIEKHFKLTELQVLCFDLDIEYDNLAGETLILKIVKLIEHMRHQGRLSDLLSKLAKERPMLSWPVWTDEAMETVNASSSFIPANAHNPFGLSGKIQNTINYLVRQPLTTHIINELRKRTSLSIVGESQSGKSSLLWYITQHGPDQLGELPENFIYLSMEMLQDDNDFYEYICDELGIETSRGFRLDRKLKKQGRRIFLCLDEIEKMTWKGFTHNVRTELRGLADGVQSSLTLVIASRSPLNRLFPDSPEMTSPLAGLCMQVNMPNFTLAEAQALAEQYLQNSLLRLEPEQVAQAWQETAGHPRRLQEKLRELYNIILMQEEKS